MQIFRTKTVGYIATEYPLTIPGIGDLVNCIAFYFC